MVQSQNHGTKSASIRAAVGMSATSDDDGAAYSSGNPSLVDAPSFFMADEVEPALSPSAQTRLEQLSNEIQKLESKENNLKTLIDTSDVLEEQAKQELVKEIELYEKEQANLFKEIKEAEAAVEAKRKELEITEAALVNGGGIVGLTTQATYLLGPLGALGLGRVVLQQRQQKQEELLLAEKELQAQKARQESLRSNQNFVSKFVDKLFTCLI